MTNPRRILDFHTHLQDAWLDIRLATPEEFIEGLDTCAVEAACVFTMMGFYGNCRAENDGLLERSQRYPDRLIPFITVDPKQGSAAVEEVERCLQNPAFRGIKLHPWLQSFAPSLVKGTLTDILRRAAFADVPVLFHDGTPPNSTTFQIAAIADWVPEAKVVLGHAGLADYVYPAGQLLRERPNLYACFCCPKAGDLPYLVESAGADKVLFGSDFGIAHWHILAERLDDVLFAELADDVLDKVLYANAAQLLHLNEKPLMLVTK